MNLTFTNRADADAFNDRCHALLMATIPGFTANRWADVVEADGVFTVYVDERVEAAMTPDQHAEAFGV